MTKQELLQFIKESRTLIRGSTPEQKVKFISLIKEAKAKMNNSEVDESSENAISVPENKDYLDEH